MKRVLFMGLPGSGKGTQSTLLEKKGFVQISTGHVIRKSTDPEIVKYREKEYAEGKLLSDEIIFRIIEEEIEKLPKKTEGYILDGASRTLEQAKYIKENDLADTVIFFDLSKGVAERRLLGRNEGRSDDNPEAIQKRFIEYREKTKPVLEYLEKNFEFHKISAEPSVKEIHDEVCKVLCL